MAQPSLTQSQTLPDSGASAILWFLKQVSGPLIVVFLLIHFIINHLVGEGGLLSYSQIIVYYQIWFVPIMEGIFLILVVGHSLLGLRSIVLDLQLPKSLTSLLDWVFLVVGVVAVVYGLWLINQITRAGIGTNF